MTVSAQAELLDKYFESLNGKNLATLLALYHPDAAQVSAARTITGRDAIQAFYTDLFTRLPGATFKLVDSKETGAGLSFQWSAEGPTARVADGNDTWALQQGLIQYHSTTFTLEAVEPVPGTKARKGPARKRSQTAQQTKGAASGSATVQSSLSLEQPSIPIGIDVSRWQQTVDWSKVKEAGYEFALIKATQGVSDIDPLFTSNWTQTKAAHLLRGAYHFFEPADDPHKQAEIFLQTVSFEPDDLPPVLDIEKPATDIDRTLFAKNM